MTPGNQRDRDRYTETLSICGCTFFTPLEPVYLFLDATRLLFGRVTTTKNMPVRGINRDGYITGVPRHAKDPMGGRVHNTLLLYHDTALLLLTYY